MEKHARHSAGIGAAHFFEAPASQIPWWLARVLPTQPPFSIHLVCVVRMRMITWQVLGRTIDSIKYMLWIIPSWITSDRTHRIHYVQMSASRSSNSTDKNTKKRRRKRTKCKMEGCGIICLLFCSWHGLLENGCGNPVLTSGTPDFGVSKIPPRRGGAVSL